MNLLPLSVLPQISIERYSFYAGPKGESLRFAEHAPEHPVTEVGWICNCTRSVAEKPSGKPKSINPNIITLRGELETMDWEFSLTSGRLEFRRGPKDSKGQRLAEPCTDFSLDLAQLIAPCGLVVFGGKTVCERSCDRD